MVNTAGKARWCGQAIEGRAAFGQGFPGVLDASHPTKRMSGTGQKIDRLPKAIRLGQAPLFAASIVLAIVPLRSSVGTRFQRYGMGCNDKRRLLPISTASILPR